MSGTGSHSMIDIVRRCRISPPPNSVPNSVVPLSFFDFPWLLCRPMQRLFFYDLPGFSVLQFTDTVFPSLKRPLSLVLQEFFPLAGGLACPPPPGKPYIIYSDGDSVPFAAAVSVGDFDELTSDRPQAAALLYPLVPHLPPPSEKDGARVSPLLAVQVTLFPNSGICIGVEFLHVAADGMAFNRFMKAWASICRKELGGETDTLCIEKTVPPVLDRTLIKDPNGLEPIMLKEWFDLVPTLGSSPSPSPYTDKLRATFTLTRAHIDQLKSYISSHIQEPLHISTFVATCAYTWACLIKSKEIGETGFSNSDIYHFSYVADCRTRLGYPIPDTYFGNCLDIRFVSLQREELVGRHGTAAAARAIGAQVGELQVEGGPLRRAGRWISDWTEVSETGRLTVVAGSSRLRVYETEFGWGRPRKSRVAHIDASDAISLAESRDEEGGVEVGLALGKTAMDAFCVMFENDGLSW